MKGIRDVCAARARLRVVAATLCLCLGGCGAANKVMSAFDRPLNVSPVTQTSLGNFTVTADDASGPVANAAAIQQAAAACAVLRLQSRTVDSASSFADGRHYFTLNFQCL